MEDLRKIDSLQLYKFWKVFAISLALIIAMFTMSKIFPGVLSPIFSLMCGGILYQVILTVRRRDGACVLVPYSIFLTLIVYSFVTIIINILNAWGLVNVYNEIVFYKGTYIPSLMYLPTAFFTLLIIYIRRKSLKICKNCRIAYADTISRNKIINIFSYESQFQLRNLIYFFGILSVLVWVYFLVFYININYNARDWYVFTWLVIISFVLDEAYFVFRYYNLYLDLRERDEVITPDEIEDMTAKTYLRFYVISGNEIYCDHHVKDPHSKYGEVIDTPFFTKRNVNGIPQSDVKTIIQRMTGVDGELRLFYGRKTGLKGHTIIRYFYFIDGTPEEYPRLRTAGEWTDYEKIKQIYSTDPARLATLSVLDTTRLSTIIMAYKTYDEYGFRRSKISSYRVNFNLNDVKNLDIDYQSEEWIKVSMFNSDTPMFRMKRWWRKLIGQSL